MEIIKIIKDNKKIINLFYFILYFILYFYLPTYREADAEIDAKADTKSDIRTPAGRNINNSKENNRFTSTPVEEID